MKKKKKNNGQKISSSSFIKTLFAEEFMITLSNMLFLQHKLLCYLKSVAHGKFAKNTTITVQHINTSGPP